VVFVADDSAVFQFVPDVVVEISSALIVRSNDERTARAVGVLSRDGVEALMSIRNLMDAALTLERRDGFTHSAMSQIVDDLLEGWIILPNDFIELRRAHPGVLKLFERPSGFDRLVLPGIANH
jgi:hypothetical protein